MKLIMLVTAQPNDDTYYDAEIEILNVIDTDSEGGELRNYINVNAEIQNLTGRDCLWLAIPVTIDKWMRKFKISSCEAQDGELFEETKRFFREEKIQAFWRGKEISLE
tara:strand:- start:176 stop:499 length:324 start_codon:yes stop_codon:yes gene_type:complete